MRSLQDASIHGSLSQYALPIHTTNKETHNEITQRFIIWALF
jgi:hypothetical protein